MNSRTLETSPQNQNGMPLNPLNIPHDHQPHETRTLMTSSLTAYPHLGCTHEYSRNHKSTTALHRPPNQPTNKLHWRPNNRFPLNPHANQHIPLDTLPPVPEFYSPPTQPANNIHWNPPPNSNPPTEWSMPPTINRQPAHNRSLLNPNAHHYIPSTAPHPITPPNKPNTRRTSQPHPKS